MRICVHKDTKKILEMQSDATEGTLIQNAVNAGYDEADLEEREVSPAEYRQAILEARTLDEVKARMNEEVDALRDGKIAAGVPYSFPDGGAGVIQTRDLVDARNIQTNATTALALQAAGQAGTVMSFRDQADVIHAMTPAQMIQMCLYVAQYGQAIYAASWAHKDAVAALETIAEVEAYDLSEGWPS